MEPDELPPTPDHDGPLSNRMAVAARDLETRTDRATTDTMATDLAVFVIDGCHVASLSVVRGGAEVVSFAATDAAGARADELPARFGVGPCPDAIDEGSMIRGPAVAQDGRWPIWGPRVVEETGLNSVLSLRLFTHENSLAALDLDSRDRAASTISDRPRPPGPSSDRKAE